jgi:hypothetical protein
MHDERPGWLGPLFWWDCVRTARLSHLRLYRFLYAAALLGMLYLVLGREELTPKTITYRAEEAMRWLLLLQLTAAVALTPATVAGLIVDERRQGTLPLLLTTFLTTREYILGKLTARLLGVVSVLLAGVPVMALLILLGGVRFMVLINMTLITIGLMVLLGFESIRASVRARTLGGAVFGAYVPSMFFAIPLYMLVMVNIDSLLVPVPIVLIGVLLVLFARRSYQLTQEALPHCDIAQPPAQLAVAHFDDPRRLSRAIEVDYREEYRELPPSGRLPVIVPDLDQEPVAQRQFAIPPIGSWPVLWKEAYFPISDVVHTLAAAGSMIVGFLLIIVAICMKVWFGHNPHAQALLVSVITSGLMLMLLVLIPSRAALSLIHEYQDKTLLSLLGTPSTSARLLLEKFLGSFWRHRHPLILTAIMLPLFTFFLPAQAFLVIPLFAGQLLCLTMLCMLIALLLRLHASRARLVVGIVLITILLITPIISTVLEFDASMWLYPSGRVTTSHYEKALERTPILQAALQVFCPLDSWSLWQQAHVRLPKEQPVYYGNPPPPYPVTWMYLIRTRPSTGSWTMAMTTLLCLTAVFFLASVWALRRLKERLS